MMGHSGPTGGQRSRWFMALFDYNPLTMSPNPDAAHEELPFKEGQVIRVSFSLHKDVAGHISF